MVKWEVPFKLLKAELLAGDVRTAQKCINLLWQSILFYSLQEDGSGLLLRSC